MQISQSRSRRLSILSLATFLAVGAPGISVRAQQPAAQPQPNANGNQNGNAGNNNGQSNASSTGNQIKNAVKKKLPF
jgi:hypothetical protein